MKKRSASRQPIFFPPENVFEYWTADQLVPYKEVEGCLFRKCDFSSANLQHKRFTDCRFEGCNLALASLMDTALQNVTFVECKLTGVSFAACRDMLFQVQFASCQLRYASFSGKRMQGTLFQQCTCAEVDFTQANLTNASFQECSLNEAVFHHTQLTGADFTTATGFSINPENNPLRGARFSLPGLLGLVDTYGVVVQ